MDREDRRKEKALLRYQIISPLINEEFKRGEKKRCLEKLSLKEWTLSTGEVSCFSIDTIRAWLRRYHCNGFEALYDKVYLEQPSKLPMDIIEEACRLKREVPERSLDKIIMIIENLQKADPGVVRRSTLHRALQARGISMRKLPASGTKDLERFSADYANDLWQSDMLAGPWLPDPNNEGKMRRCWLYAFIDDASRLILYGRFFFKGDLPALELVFKRSLQRFGVPQRVYYDNGAVYRSIHMRSACAELGIKPPVFTKPYRPMGHGKIEAFNRFCNNNFIAETKASHISTLDELNEAFVAWLEEEYNHRPNTELGMTPHARWSRDDKRIQYIDEEKLRVAFLWREQRTPDKCGILSLFNREYKVSSLLGKKRVDIRYCPDEDLDEIEV
ncbi:MAG: DDE-type integrase/transposase/recombinase [Candidatus Brocadiales bacterium]|nr:DDE-type integrase/transposase/recombinase [Candidatus Brocadiales bacterium]